MCWKRGHVSRTREHTLGPGSETATGAMARNRCADRHVGEASRSNRPGWPHQDPQKDDSALKKTFRWPLLVTSALEAIRDGPLIRGQQGCGRRTGKEGHASVTRVDDSGSLWRPPAARNSGTHLCTQQTLGLPGPPVCHHKQARLPTTRDSPFPRPLLQVSMSLPSCSLGNIPPRCMSPTLNLSSPKPTSEWLSLKSPAS